ncbi:hypothetical protein Naga_100366g1 [Nannochloropsis gaditana]|uniref:Uncharacterized protein n=1 Tax=Nannochloropsis gaditana TaxID=72520 RepID=W7TT29_9STRA|nr:hypothetical protein Naga_100366g1 [Nannochloropsis gaditana]
MRRCGRGRNSCGRTTGQIPGCRPRRVLISSCGSYSVPCRGIVREANLGSHHAPRVKSPRHVQRFGLFGVGSMSLELKIAMGRRLGRWLFADERME